MKISLSLIRQYLPLQSSVQEIADRLTLLGLEVERIENELPSYSGVVVGLIESAKRHPQADSLMLLKVSDGKESFDVVCGDTGCQQGMKVAFAKIGARLKDKNGKEIEIRKVKLRGVESFGMLCAADELCLAKEAFGVLKLDSAFETGEDLSGLLWDPVFDISLTPNLGHCMSALGVARELAAVMDRKIELPKFTLHKSLNGWSIEVENKELCPRYACALIRNVAIAPSPFWLQIKLQMCGIRPINNIVDVTNLVMLELGQPMHAFDANKIHGKKIRVAPEKGKKNISFLDGTVREAPEGALSIQDSKGSIALAGIMGGSESAVSARTRDILLEAAYLNPLSVRKTATGIGLRTESSIRFEKGTDPDLIPIALERACLLIAELYPESSFEGMIDLRKSDLLPKKIHLRIARVQKILGYHFSLSEVNTIFCKLDFETKTLAKDTLQVTVPIYRSDISEEIDLIEEVARIYGYNNIAKIIPKFTGTKLKHNPLFSFEDFIRNRLISEGLQEILNCDLISPRLAEITKELSHPSDSLVKVKHSKSNEHSILRPCLLAGMLQTLALNRDRKSPDLSLFEIGRIHLRKEDKYIEQQSVAILLSGKESPHTWDHPAHFVDFFTLKGMTENLMDVLKFKDVQYKRSAHLSFHPANQAKICVKEADVGVIGELHPETLGMFDIKQKAFFCELNLYSLMNLRPRKITLEEIPLFPSSERDWTVTLDDSFEISRILEDIKAFSSSLLEKIELLDLFKGKNVPTGKKNATFRFTYRDRKKTVSFDNVEKEHSKIIGSITNRIS